MPDAAVAPMNRLVLSAQLVERGVLRYTPAGLPAIDCRLQHESTLTEDGQPRKVSLEIKALAIGAIARQLGVVVLGSYAQFGGFLASVRNGRGLLFHITELTPGAPAPVLLSEFSPELSSSNPRPDLVSGPPGSKHLARH